MLLHRIKPKILNLNTAIRNLTKPINNDLAIVNYEKENEYFDINININEILINNPENNDALTEEEDEAMVRSMLKSTAGFNVNWKPLQNIGIYAISFYIDSSNNAIAVYKYSNVLALLPISNNLIYAATSYITTTWTQGNIFSVTRQNIFDNTFFFNAATMSVVGQGVNPPNTLDNKIYAIATDASNNIYIGGSFYINDGTPDGIKGFAKWDIIEQKWVSLRGINGIKFNLQSTGAVYSIIVIDQNNIYVGGYFNYIDQNNPIASQASSFVKWNGIFWDTTLLELTNIDGSPANVYAMKRDGNSLYIGGSIYAAKKTFGNPSRVYNIFRYDTVTTSIGLLQGGTSGPVYAMDINTTPSSKCLYVGGAFVSVFRSTTASGVPSSSFIVNNLARWNIVGQGTLYPRNQWTQIQYSTSASITPAQYPNTATSTVKNRINGNRGVPGTVYAIAVNPRSRNLVWVGGTFEPVSAKDRIVSWASQFISYFNINRNFTTSLWTKVIYGRPQVPAGLGTGLNVVTNI